MGLERRERDRGKGEMMGGKGGGGECIKYQVLGV